MCYYVNIGNKATTRRVTRRMPIVEQELLTLPENLISYPIFSGVRIAQSLAFCVVFLLVLLSFFFGNCIVCLFYGLWVLARICIVFLLYKSLVLVYTFFKSRSRIVLPVSKEMGHRGRVLSVFILREL